ncbi:MAG TPA: ATP-binding protein [Polyangiaceae bacterium]|nr:ATP-binding protein [Polyangiaceae bacterium]
MVLARDLDPERRTRLERVRAAVAGGAHSRFEDPSEILRVVCTHVYREADRRNVPLVVHCACRRVSVRETFTEALCCLLDNAIEATDAGHPVVLEAREYDDRLAVWEIRDLGHGMTAGALADLGSPYSVARAPGGVAIANAIIQEHDGVLRFESGVGLGTTATVWLPLT